jgi:hypothetical protein
MSSRGILALVLIALATGAERFAYYGSRTFMARDLIDSGRTTASLTAAFTAITWGTLLATFIGAGLSYAIGPRITATIGVGIATLGYFVLAFTDGPLPGWILIAGGVGIFRVCPYVMAADVLSLEPGSDPQNPASDNTGGLSPRRFAAVSAFAIGTYALINMGAASSAPIITVFRTSLGRTASLIATGCAALFAVLLAGGAALLGMSTAKAVASSAVNDPYRAPAPVSSPQGFQVPPTTTASTQALTGLAILAISAAIFTLGTSIDMPPQTAAIRDMAWLYSLNPSVITIASIALFVVFLVATMGRWTMTPLLLLAIGVSVAGLGFLITAASSVAESVAVYAVGAVITGGGEATFPIATAYAALAVRGRGAAIVVAVWFAATTVIANGANSFVGFGGARTGLLALAGLAAIAAGVAFAIKARKLQSLFDGDPLRGGGAADAATATRP